MPKEFTTLIVDLLVEASRRHMLATNTLQSNIELKAHIFYNMEFSTFSYIVRIHCFSDPAVSLLRKEQLGKHGSQVSDDEPLYDSVASDDDYAALTSTDNTSSDVSNQLKVSNEVSFDSRGNFNTLFLKYKKVH